MFQLLLSSGNEFNQRDINCCILRWHCSIKVDDGRFWWACWENPETGDRGHRHKSAAEDRSESIGLLIRSYTRCEKEITLPEQLRTHVDKKLIALRPNETSPWYYVDSFSSSSEPESHSKTWWAFPKVTLSSIGNSFSYIFKGRLPADYISYCSLPHGLIMYLGHSRIRVSSAWDISFGGIGDVSEGDSVLR